MVLLLDGPVSRQRANLSERLKLPRNLLIRFIENARAAGKGDAALSAGGLGHAHRIDALPSMVCSSADGKNACRPPKRVRARREPAGGRRAARLFFPCRRASRR